MSAILTYFDAIVTQDRAEMEAHTAAGIAPTAAARSPWAAETIPESTGDAKSRPFVAS
jgi:hypothetical protein